MPDRRILRVGLLGYGRVGQAIAAQVARDDNPLREMGVDVRPVIALVRDREKSRSPCLDLCTDASHFFSHHLDLVIEVMGGVHPACEFVRQALEAGVPVVTANKSLMAEKGVELRALAQKCGVPLACEAAVIAGVPFLGALARRPMCRRVRRITGILNGTSHFLTSAVTDGRPWDDALADAVRLGYAEPDSEADISGRDAAEKLSILLQFAGWTGTRASDIPKSRLDALEAFDYLLATRLQCVVKPLAFASLTADTGAWSGPALIPSDHRWAATRGVESVVCLEGDDAVPVTFAGPGAGPEVTAATILDDLAETLTSKPGAETPVGSADVAAESLRQPPSGAWYVRIARGVETLEGGDVAEHLATHRIAAERVTSTPAAIGAITTRASWDGILAATEAFRAIGHDVALLPALTGACRE